MKIQFKPLITKIPATKKTLVLTVADKKSVGPVFKELDKESNGALSAAMTMNPNFNGAKGQSLFLTYTKNKTPRKIILFGMDAADKLTIYTAHHVGAKIFETVSKNTQDSISLIIDENENKPLASDVVAAIAGGILIKSYGFYKYKTTLMKKDKLYIQSIELYSKGTKAVQSAFKQQESLAQAMDITRDMGNEPPNVMTPIKAVQTVQILKKAGVKLRVLDDKTLEKIGMGALLAVGRGSSNPPRVVIMEYKNTRKKTQPVVFVGKGVTFDSGGLSLKPGPSMIDMKFDMQGASTVVGAIYALAKRKAKAHVIGIVGFVENMPDGNAFRVSDIITSLSGQTVEIQNTDAEGRLVLADLIHYAQDKFKPKVIVDLATLTGACVVSLGCEYAALFTNNETLSKQLNDAGQKTGDRVWRLPLDDAYDRQLESAYADMRNIGNTGEAGAITAAHFIMRFVDEKQAWAHIDIAGTANSARETPLSPKGATAFGVRLLDRFIADYHEG
jgi:leucyl aminopeptidase